MKAKTLSNHWQLTDNISRKGIVEKRQHERFSTELKGEAVYHSHVTHIEVLDMSKGGALLRTADLDHDMPREGEIVDISLSWPMKNDKKPLHVEGVVVRINSNEFAVAFGHTKKAVLH